MQSSMTVNSLLATLDDIRESNGYSFEQLHALLSRITQDDVVSMLNDLMERKVILNEFEVFSEDHVYIARRRDFHLLLRFVHPSNPNRLYCNEYDAFVLNPGHHTISFAQYKVQLDREQMFEEPPPLQRIDDFVLSPGECRLIRAFDTILDFSNPTGAGAAHAFVLIAHSEPRDILTWVFDRASGAPVEAICTDLTASRAQLYVRLLGAMKAQRAVPTLRHIATSGYTHFVRWEAIESLAQINGEACIETLKYLAENDLDHRIRHTARLSLDQSRC